MVGSRKIGILIIVWFALCVGLAPRANAIPDLQIYSPGATYDTATETWIIDGTDYELWVVGANDAIFDVKVAFAVPENENGSIAVTWVKGSASVPSYLDPNASKTLKGPGTSDVMSEGVDGADKVAATYFFEDNGTPVMGSGAAIPPHGVFPSSYYEYYIGDFGETETVVNYFPGEMDNTATGEIKQFHVVVSGYTWADIVAYDHIVMTNGKIHSVFSPFSHDGGGGTPLSGEVPEPATILMVGSGLLAIAALARKRQQERNH